MLPRVDSMTFGSANVGALPTYDSLKRLASQVVAFHLCDQGSIDTCLVADFVHSIAAQLYNAPFLVAYKVSDGYLGCISSLQSIVLVRIYLLVILVPKVIVTTPIIDESLYLFIRGMFRNNL